MRAVFFTTLYRDFHTLCCTPVCPLPGIPLPPTQPSHYTAFSFFLKKRKKATDDFYLCIEVFQTRSSNYSWHTVEIFNIIIIVADVKVTVVILLLLLTIIKRLSRFRAVFMDKEMHTEFLTSTLRTKELFFLFFSSFLTSIIMVLLYDKSEGKKQTKLVTAESRGGSSI